MSSDITSEEAATRHGITTRHQIMDNGELRFRLLKNDGTAYIRTEASSAGAWQNSHFHKRLRETYIVQRGWIAYAIFENGCAKITIFQEGGLFTTQPGVVHNIYMPKDTVLHTVKHGIGVENDRIEDDNTREFDKIITGICEIDIISNLKNIKENINNNKYTEEYRHFDKLIWQVPAWGTAIFAVTAAGTNSIKVDNFLVSGTGFSVNSIAAGFLGLMFLVILALSHALHRFRVHQSPLRHRPSTPVWKSASMYLQLIVTVEAFSLFFLFLTLVGSPLILSGVVCVLLVAVTTIFREVAVRKPGSRQSV